MIVRIATLVITMLLVSCSDNNGGLEGSIDRRNKPIEITVTTVKSEAELNRLYSEKTGVPNSQVPDQYGFAQWNERKIGEPDNYRCDIYILEPKRVDDNNILTLGHEMAHCVWGSYHK